MIVSMIDSDDCTSSERRVGAAVVVLGTSSFGVVCWIYRVGIGVGSSVGYTVGDIVDILEQERYKWLWSIYTTSPETNNDFAANLFIVFFCF